MIQRLLLASMIVFASSFAFAEEEALPSSSSVATASFPKLSHYSFGFESGYFVYREPGLMQDAGFLSGLHGQYEWNWEANRLRIEGSLLYGQIAYTGATWDGTPVTDSSRDTLINIRALYAHDFKFATFTVSPLTGLGFRYLNDRGIGEGSYEREITYMYLPLGAELDWRVSDRVHVGLTPEIDAFLGGSVKTHLSDYDSSLPDLQNTQDSGWGARLAAHLGWRFNTFALNIEPYWQHWTIGASDSKWINDKYKYGAEPDNNSDQYGLNVLIQL